ncbi:kinase-like protein, partial [Clavulina sp. PMI_390]
QLGDLLGKGAFGQVYRALNWTNGETVAVKQIQLASIPKAELGEIMSEIDLLKNLNHINIVKYKGFVKTREYLYIILEYCENGSLHNICKRFGKFPENLVAVYISQVLEGLVYLHEQGVIHHDIKGANILTNKDGSVKLADFGVASTSSNPANDGAVVGSPYWMAPEVIEQSGATTASDVWSVGCVVIELLEGKPPYHFLDPMPAMFRIVQDDSPPIPEGISPASIVKDFLYHCFQKDPNLRISAKKLLRHPWMSSARKQLGSETAHGEKALFHDEAVQRVQKWNEALKSPTRSTQERPRKSTHQEVRNMPLGVSLNLAASTSSRPMGPSPASQLAEKLSNPIALPQKEDESDNWDDDFEGAIAISKLQLPSDKSAEEERIDFDENLRTIRPSSRSQVSPFSSTTPPVEDYSDLADENDDAIMKARIADFKARNANKKSLYHPDDIKTAGFAQPRSHSGPVVHHTSSPPITPGGSLANRPRPTRPGISPTTPTSSSGAHSRSLSVGSNSMGRIEAQRVFAQAELGRYVEEEDEDYEDVFIPSGDLSHAPTNTLRLNTKLPNKSWLGDADSDEEDPFAEIDEDFVEDDLETNLQRDKHARLCSLTNNLIDQLLPNAADYTLRDVCSQLLNLALETPEMQLQIVSSHGLLAILEVLESGPSRDVVVNLLKLTNILVTADLSVLESFCLIGGIPVVMTFASKKYAFECRSEASQFVQLLCHSSLLTLQMFISCRGLKVLVDLLDEDYQEQADLVGHAVVGVGSVFELQSPTPKNDFCRMFIREGLLDPLSTALLSVARPQTNASEMVVKILQIILVFSQVSQSDNHVRQAVGTRKIVRRLLRACELLAPEHLVLLLKSVKHLSMNVALLDVLQQANAIDVIVRILEAQDTGPYTAETSNHIFQTCFNLCRLNKSRQEEAAQAGIIPCLKRVFNTSSPLRQFALPILCDLAAAGKSCRLLLWQQSGLDLYLDLLADQYFSVSALEAIMYWLQEETSRVEDVLCQPGPMSRLLGCFVNAKANSFENLLDPFLKICRLSTLVVVAISSTHPFFLKLAERLSHPKAVVRLNLLRLLRIICDVSPEKAVIVDKYGFLGLVRRLREKDSAVLVNEMAGDLIPILSGGTSSHAPISKSIPDAAFSRSTVLRRKAPRRSASEIPEGAGSAIVSLSKPRQLKPKSLDASRARVKDEDSR